MKEKFYGIVRFTDPSSGEMEHFTVQAIDWVEDKRAAISEFNRNCYTVYAVFTAKELEQMKSDLLLPSYFATDC